MKLAYPPDPVLPAELSADATFVLSDWVDPGASAVVLTFYPPQPCTLSDSDFPPNPCDPDWSLGLPEGCFVAGRKASYVLEEEGCAASLRRTAIDGTYQDVSEYLRSLKGRLDVPTQSRLYWQLRLKVGFALDNGITWPPNPCRGGTQLVVGDEYGRADTAQCEWQSR